MRQRSVDAIQACVQLDHQRWCDEQIIPLGDQQVLADARFSVDNALYPLVSSFAEQAGSGSACPDMSTELIGVYLDYLGGCGLLPQRTVRGVK